MKKNLIYGLLAVLVVFLVAFFALKPKAPELGSIAVVTQNEEDVMELPTLEGNLNRYELEDGAEMQWTGRKVGGEHFGTISLSEGAVVVDEDNNVAGKFIIDMNDIKIMDIEESSPSYSQLLGHLREGFFDVENHPTAEFNLKKATLITDNVYEVVGDLEIVGVSREITFPAIINIEDDYAEVKANFFIDRGERGISEVVEIVDKYIEFGLDLYFSK